MVRFSDPAMKWIRAEAKRLDIKISELLRRIVDEKRGAVIKTVPDVNAP